MGDTDIPHVLYRAEAALQNALDFLKEMPEFKPFEDGRDISLVYYRKEAVMTGTRTVLDIIKEARSV